MFLLLITISLCITYGILYFVFPFFFTQKLVHGSRTSVSSLLTIFTLSILGYIIVFNIPDPELSNRILHGFGGGFMALLVCFLVVKDTKLNITKFQFIIFSLLIVGALGIVNEILEFILQTEMGIIFAEGVNDTWYDLVSNLIGSLIAALVFTPFINNKCVSKEPSART